MKNDQQINQVNKRNRHGEDAKAATPLLGRNGLKYSIIDKVEIFRHHGRATAVNIDPRVDTEFEKEIKVAVEIRRPQPNKQQIRTTTK